MMMMMIETYIYNDRVNTERTNNNEQLKVYYTSKKFPQQDCSRVVLVTYKTITYAHKHGKGRKVIEKLIVV
jgi:hypothetical protein